MYWPYEKKQLSNGTHVYEHPVNLPFAGNTDGLFFHAYKKLSDARRAVVCPKQELLSILECVPETHALVIDTAPGRVGVCLHEIHAVAGFTDDP